MNNEELSTIFEAIDNENDCFNRVLLLKQYKKQYKKSDFYKKTHLSIVKAYKIYQTSKVQNLYFLTKNSLIIALLKGDKARAALELEEAINSFDFTRLDGIIEYIVEKLNKLDITVLKEELEDVVAKLQDSFLKK